MIAPSRGAMRPDLQMTTLLNRSDLRGQQSLEKRRGRPLTSLKRTSVIPAPGPCKCIGRSPGKCHDIRTTVFASMKNRRDIVHDKDLCIAVWQYGLQRR